MSNASQHFLRTGCCGVRICGFAGKGIDSLARRIGQIARDLDVSGQRPVDAGTKHPRNRLGGTGRIVNNRLIARYLPEDAQLRVGRPNMVVNEKPARTLCTRGRCRQYDDRRALSIGSGNSIDEVQRAGPVRDGSDSNTAGSARRGIRGEADARLMTQRVQG